MTRTNRIQVGFFGLSHLGLVTMVAFANKDVHTYGYDPDVNLVNHINLGNFAVEEPNLLATFHNKRSNITVSSDYHILNSCNIIYFSNDIETDSFGFSNLTKAKRLLKQLISHMTSSQILVILSQVPPGFTRSIAKLHPNTNYQVETLIFGDALARAETPERIIVGTKDGKIISKQYEALLSLFQCPILVMNYESAEFTKITINMYLVNDIVLTNALSQIVRTHNGKWSDIRPALQLDRRIGSSAYLNPGLGISGGNLERDIRTWETLCNPSDQAYSLMKVFTSNSRKQKQWLVSEITRVLRKHNYRIALLGLSYKENTNSIKNAASNIVYKKFRNHIVRVYDPLIKDFPGAKKSLFASNISQCVLNTDLLIILTPSIEFFGIETTVNNSTIKCVIDPFNVLTPSLLSAKSYISNILVRQT